MVRVARRRLADSYSHPDEIGGPKRLHYRADPVVSGISPAGLDPDMSGLKVEFVVHYDETLGRNFEIAKQRRNAVTGTIVVGLGLHQQHALAGDFRLAGCALETPATELNVLCLGYPIQDQVPGVVPRAGVFLSRVSESGDHPRDRGARFLRFARGRFSRPPKAAKQTGNATHHALRRQASPNSARSRGPSARSRAAISAGVPIEMRIASRSEGIEKYLTRIPARRSPRVTRLRSWSGIRASTKFASDGGTSKPILRSRTSTVARVFFTRSTLRRIQAESESAAAPPASAMRLRL